LAVAGCRFAVHGISPSPVKPSIDLRCQAVLVREFGVKFQVNEKRYPRFRAGKTMHDRLN
jgi:hypothetical protein